MKKFTKMMVWLILILLLLGSLNLYQYLTMSVYNSTDIVAPLRSVFFKDVLSKILIAIIAVVGIVWQLVESRKQKARDYYSKSRLNWIENTRALYAEWVSLIFIIVNYPKDDNYIRAKIERFNYLSSTLCMMFNPRDEFDKDIVKFINFVKNRLIIEDKYPNLNRIRLVNEGIELLNIMMNYYFKNEWEKAKSNIDGENYDSKENKKSLVEDFNYVVDRILNKYRIEATNSGDSKEKHEYSKLKANINNLKFNK